MGLQNLGLLFDLLSPADGTSGGGGGGGEAGEHVGSGGSSAVVVAPEHQARVCAVRLDDYLARGDAVLMAMRCAGSAAYPREELGAMLALFVPTTELPSFDDEVGA